MSAGISHCGLFPVAEKPLESCQSQDIPKRLSRERERALQFPLSQSMSCIYVIPQIPPNQNIALLFIKMSDGGQRSLVKGNRWRWFASSHLLDFILSEIQVCHLRNGEISVRLLRKSKETSKLQHHSEGPSALWGEKKGKNDTDSIHASR